MNILSADCDWVYDHRTQEQFLSKIIPILNKDKTIFAYDHDKIYTHLFNHKEDINIINIDYHHDCGYTDIYESLKGLNKVDESNWLYHLSSIFKNKINYIWINHPDSEPMHFRIYKKIKQNLKSYEFDHNIPNLNFKLDKIFICCSPQWGNSFSKTTYKIIEKVLKNEL